MKSFKISLFCTLLLCSLVLGNVLAAAAFGQSFGQSMGQPISPSLHHSNHSPLVRLEGLSPKEKTRLMGFLRSAAYGEKVPGAMHLSTKFRSKVNGGVSREKAESKPNSDDDNECFFQIPERLSLFKSTTDKDPCTGLGTLLIADTDTQILYLCKNGKAVADFDFAQGWNGIQKRKEGDERTPLGVYSIKAPRRSESGFHKFIHINYPTSYQKSLGYTGSEIGIHGPSRWIRCLGRLTTYFNWTDGCLAVASDRDINEVSQFVIDNSVSTLAVYPLEETGNSLEKFTAP